MYRSQFTVNGILDILNRLQKKDHETMSAYPEISGMMDISQGQKSILSIEHHNEGINPVWSHLYNVIAQKLSGLAQNNIDLFQYNQSINNKNFSWLVSLYQSISYIPDLACCLHAALLFSDISKGLWAQQKFIGKMPEIDFSVHNDASFKILQTEKTLQRVGMDELCESIVLGLVQSHGLIGQFLRGEITYHAFKPYCEFLRKNSPKFAEKYLNGDMKKAEELLSTTYFLLNVLDTAGVREGLMTDGLLDRFKAIDLSRLSHGNEPLSLADEIQARQKAIHADLNDESLTRILSLAMRLEHLREKRRSSGEPENEVFDTVMGLDEKEISWFDRHFNQCQLWYCESATGDLSAISQLKIITMGMHIWENSPHYRDAEVFHLDLSPIAMVLSPYAQAPTPQLALSRSNYRKRLLETILANESFASLMDGTSAVYGGDVMFGIEGKRGGQHSVILEIRESEEATALITLLSIYERKSSVAYHSALKLLCDLYHLRKDDFDRLANEAQYLLTMNAAKSDKERMLRWLHAGKIVEIGPGGGVVLDLLEQHFPTAEITGIDLSHQVVIALQQKKHVQNASWNIIEGNAFDLPKYFDKETLDGVIFCSILHEIYSYVEKEDGSRFHMESVRDMLRSAFETLKPGGRILIRDGIMPPHENRMLRFCCEDAKEFFEAFCHEFKGRPIEYQYLEPNLVSLDSADAMEFMYTYTWGPDSFPYEVREQYGIMTYQDYCKHIQEWLGPHARILQIPDNEAQYLQQGYVTALQDRLKLMDKDGNPVEFPPSNAIIVIEKTIPTND